MNFQSLRCFKKFKFSSRLSYTSNLNFFCALRLKFLNALLI